MEDVMLWAYKAAPNWGQRRAGCTGCPGMVFHRVSWAAQHSWAAEGVAGCLNICPLSLRLLLSEGNNKNKTQSQLWMSHHGLVARGTELGFLALLPDVPEFPAVQGGLGAPQAPSAGPGPRHLGTGSSTHPIFLPLCNPPKTPQQEP